MMQLLFYIHFQLNIACSRARRKLASDWLISTLNFGAPFERKEKKKVGWQF